MNKRRKGISPIISTVLLVAFAIALATIVGPWLTGFTKERGQEVEDRGEKQVNCVYSAIDFDIDDIYYNLSDDTYPDSSVNITITNSGSEDVYDPKISLHVSNRMYSYEPIQDTDLNFSNKLEAGTQAYLVTNITDELSGTLKEVRVVFQNCPNNAVRSCDLVNDECE
ncbi:MAG: archaellin/type IV pilin N-terminal domain-containing protein [Candidatus Aenigmatarchaeota archaeon]